MICNLEVVGSSPTRGSGMYGNMGVFQSGQMGQTVNLLRQRFGGSNPSAPTKQLCIVVAAPKGKCGNLVQIERKLAFAVQCSQD